MIEIKIKLPLCNQHDTEHDSQWTHRICAICSLWMLLKFYIPEFNVSAMELVKKGLAKDGYLENIGWKHTAIVDLARDFGLKLQYAKRFFYTLKEKESGLLIINGSLENGRPVMVSVSRTESSHIFVVHGLKKSGDRITGYYVQDPDGRGRGHNYFLAKPKFLTTWRGGLIY